MIHSEIDEQGNIYNFYPIGKKALDLILEPIKTVEIQELNFIEPMTIYKEKNNTESSAIYVIKDNETLRCVL